MYQAINKLFIVVLCVLTVVKSYGQVLPKDSTGQKTAAQHLVSYFNKQIKEQSNLFNGAYYQFYVPQITGSAFFTESQAFVKGSVIYDTYLYEDVPLLYDSYRDILISVLYDGNSKFSLVSEKVAEFIISGHKFIYINQSTNVDKTALKTGFYDLLYDGSMKILVKRSKLMKEVNEAPYARRFFVTKDNYFLEKDKIVYPFSNAASFLKLFQKEKNILKKYLKNNGIKFKEDPEKAMVLLAKYHDSLPH